MLASDGSSRGRILPRQNEVPLRDWFMARVTIENRGWSAACWTWRLCCCRKGYSRTNFVFGGRKFIKGHQASYRVFVGEVAEGLHIDHLCRNRACVNPDHLEAVTPQENRFRQMVAQRALGPRQFCDRKHRLDASNVYVTRAGWRACRMCRRLSQTGMLGKQSREAA